MRKRNLKIIGWGPVVAALVPLALFEYLRSFTGADPILRVPRHHFVIVSVASLLAGLIAGAVGLAARRQRNIEASFLAMAFMSLGLLFSIHGLATPGFLLPPSPLPGAMAQLSILPTAAWLLLSSSPSDLRGVAWLGRWQGLLIPLWGVCLLAIGAASLVFPHAWGHAPLNLPPLVWPMAVAVIVMLLVAAARYWYSYTYSRFPLQLAIVHACLWLAVAQWIMMNGTLWRLSWWLYHFLFVAATAALIVGIVWQYGQGTTLVAAVRGLFLADPVERVAVGLSSSVRALVAAVEARDRYTAGHAHRVTVAALQVAQAMGLSGDQLRALAQGGMVHDIGKLDVPDAILNKRGALTAEEHVVVRRHPVVGHEMCKRLGFMREELEVIRHHHERWDGSGYPDGLAGEAIPLLARILAVADVYDALTSDRSYRGAWRPEQAHAYIVQAAGREFDPEVVRVWRALHAIPAGSREPPREPVGALH
ncbi:MAG: HD-GYP domain-containing protein [Armatimonadota bacterium]|nr:HD-GYP domain-containing protein [Armatimonadota bacterium]